MTNAHIDPRIEKDPFEQRGGFLLLEQKGLDERLTQHQTNGGSLPDRLAEFLELARATYLAYKIGVPEEKRDLLKTVTSNRQVDGKTLVFTLAPPFDEVANRFQNANSAPYRDTPRTWDRLLENPAHWFKANPAPPTWATLILTPQNSRYENLGKDGQLAA